MNPSGADPVYPPNHMLDGEVQDLGSLPNADFEDPSTNVGTPPTNANLQTPPTSVVTVPNGTFSTGTFANWVKVGTATIQTGGPNGQWARLDSSGASITSAAITVPTNAQELVYDINYVSTTSNSGVEVNPARSDNVASMTTSRESKAVHELLTAGLSLVSGLRLQEGLDEVQYQAVLQALDSCGSEWLGQDVIPRLAVSLLVDLAPSVIDLADAYPEPSASHIRRAGMEIWSKVNEAVRVEILPASLEGLY